MRCIVCLNFHPPVHQAVMLWNIVLIMYTRDFLTVALVLGKGVLNITCISSSCL